MTDDGAMDSWDVEDETGSVEQTEVLRAAAEKGQRSGVVLLLVKREEVTSDWLSFFL